MSAAQMIAAYSAGMRTARERTATSDHMRRLEMERFALVEQSPPQIVDVVREGEDRFPLRGAREAVELGLRFFRRQVGFFYKKSVEVDGNAFLDRENSVSSWHVSHDPSVGEVQ